MLSDQFSVTNGMGKGSIGKLWMKSPKMKSSLLLEADCKFAKHLKDMSGGRYAGVVVPPIIAAEDTKEGLMAFLPTSPGDPSSTSIMSGDCELLCSISHWNDCFSPNFLIYILLSIPSLHYMVDPTTPKNRFLCVSTSALIANENKIWLFVGN